MWRDNLNLSVELRREIFTTWFLEYQLPVYDSNSIRWNSLRCFYTIFIINDLIQTDQEEDNEGRETNIKLSLEPLSTPPTIVQSKSR